MEQVYDAVVIGAGVNGSGSALHLARLGKKTALIEQFPIPHTRGSSSGQTRIIRYANSNKEELSPLMVDSFQKWKDLERETGISLLRKQKLFVFTTSSNKKVNEAVEASILKAGQSPKYYSGKEFNDDYGTSLASNSLVIEDTGAGILMADKCVHAIQERFVTLGGKILEQWPVEVISPLNQDGNSVVLKSKNGDEIKTKSLVICAGPWSSNVLSYLGIHVPLRPTKVDVFYWRMKDVSRKTFSCIYYDEKNGHHIYGLPSIEYPNMVKICFHDGVECDPDERDIIPESSDNKEKVCRLVEKLLPWIHPEPVIHEKCMYTITPDCDMIIDYHPKYKNIVFGCGFSGTGFKTGLTVGQILAEMAVGLSPSFDISAFKSHRFAPEDVLKSQL